MSISLDDKIDQLAAAQHRRLLAINEEIRKARKLSRKEGHVPVLAMLANHRTAADQAYSAILKIKKEPLSDVKSMRYDTALQQYQRG